jgi:hypothetical protein
MARRGRLELGGGDELRGTAGPQGTRQRLLVVGLLVVALLLAAAGTTIAARSGTAEAAPSAPTRRRDAARLPRSTTTIAPASTTAAGTPTTSSTAGLDLPAGTPVAVPPAGSPTAGSRTADVASEAAAEAGDPSGFQGDGTPTAPPPAPRGDCGGQALTKPDGSPWVCSFDDEFSGSAVDTALWRVQETSWNGFHNGSECFVDSPNNVSVSGGALHLTVRKEARGFVCQRPRKPYNTQWTSGMLTTYGKYTQAFGRFEIRAKFPAGDRRGLQSSFWLWPQNPTKYGTWPNSGEIDMAEYYSQWPDRVVPYVHYTGSTYHVTNNNCLVADPSDWHTYLMIWTRTAISVSIDGRSCLYMPINPLIPLHAPAPFDQPFMISLTQSLGIRSNAFQDGSTPLPATTTVDYVRTWR